MTQDRGQGKRGGGVRWLLAYTAAATGLRIWIGQSPKPVLDGPAHVDPLEALGDKAGGVVWVGPEHGHLRLFALAEPDRDRIHCHPPRGMAPSKRFSCLRLARLEVLVYQPGDAARLITVVDEAA